MAKKKNSFHIDMNLKALSLCMTIIGVDTL